MVDLVEWLTACLDEDAKRAITWHDLECEIHQHMDAGLLAAVAASRMLEDVPGAVCDCGGPARVLREIDAKRQLLDRYKHAMENRRAHPDDLASAGALLALHGAVKVLALPYSHRPGYREEWAP